LPGHKKFKTEEAAKNWISKKKAKNYEIRKLKTGRVKVIIK